MYVLNSFYHDDYNYYCDLIILNDVSVVMKVPQSLFLLYLPSIDVLMENLNHLCSIHSITFLGKKKSFIFLLN